MGMHVSTELLNKISQAKSSLDVRIYTNKHAKINKCQLI